MKLLIFMSLILLGTVGFSAEEKLDLGNLDKAPEAKSAGAVGAALSKFSFMGRVELTLNISPYGQKTPDTSNSVDRGNAQYSSNHFLVFLKVKASPKVDFMGEFVDQSFYHVNYHGEPFTASFGKILVPFGDTRRFHHFYGGVQGLPSNGRPGTQGVMFPNIWAENGVNFEWDLFSNTKIDTYVVTGFEAGTGPNAGNLDLRSNSSASGKRMAGGLRATFNQIPDITLIASGYFSDWMPGRPLAIYGGDVYSDYGFANLGVFNHLRFAFGRVVAQIQKSAVGDYRKEGDFAELATNLLSWGELRARYGTYIHNSQTKSATDTHSWAAGFTTQVDVLRFLAEYQWNYEAQNEIENDTFRIMTSLDF